MMLGRATGRRGRSLGALLTITLPLLAGVAMGACAKRQTTSWSHTSAEGPTANEAPAPGTQGPGNQGPGNQGVTMQQAPNAGPAASPPGAAEAQPSPSPGAPSPGTAPEAYTSPNEGAQNPAQQRNWTTPLVSGLDDQGRVGAALTISDQAIRLAQIGEGKATTQVVKRFARNVSSGATHTKAEIKATATKLAITPTESAASADARSRASEGCSDLQATHGSDFDKLYVAEEVNELSHNRDMLDAMAAQATSPEVQAELRRASARMESLVREGQALNDTLREPNQQQPNQQQPQGGGPQP